MAIRILCVLSLFAASLFLAGCGGSGDTPEPGTATETAAHDGSFKIFVHQTGKPPVEMTVKETTPISDVHAFAADKLGLGAETFDLRIAGKPIEGTIADLGFKDPGPGFTAPVGNIKVKVK